MIIIYKFISQLTIIGIMTGFESESTEFLNLSKN